VSAAWATTGDYLFDRAQRGPAALAYVEAWDAAGERAEQLERAVRGLAYALASLHETMAQLAALGVLERRGLLGELPGPRQHLAGVRMTPWQRRNVDRALGSDGGARAEIDRSLRTWRERLPRFTTDFVAGRLRFDDSDQVFACVREPAREESLMVQGATRMLQRARRLLWRRVAILVLPVVLGALILALFSGWPDTSIGWTLLIVVGLGYLTASAYGVLLLVRLLRPARMEVEQLRRIDALTSSTHHHAYAVLKRYAEDRQPFGLLLRSFGAEASEQVVPGLQDTRADRASWADAQTMAGTPMQSQHAYTGGLESAMTQLHGSSTLERWLAATKDPAVPFITVTNPAAARETGVLPRLDLSYRDWESAVLLLISAAHVIMVEATSATAGVLAELQFVLSRARERDTVVVVSAPRADHSSILGVLAGGPARAAAPPLTEDNPALAAFPHVLREEEVLTLDTSDTLLAVLAGEPIPNAADTDLDLPLALTKTARMIDEGEPELAREALEHIVELARQNGDARVEAEANFRLGLAHHRLQDYPSAEHHLRTSLDMASRCGLEEIEGLASSNLGWLLMRSEERAAREEAGVRLTRAVTVQRHLDSDYNLAWSLRQLVALVDGKQRMDLAREWVTVADRLTDVPDRFHARQELLIALCDAAEVVESLAQQPLLGEATAVLEEMQGLVNEGGEEEQRLVLPVLAVHVHEAAGRTEQALVEARRGLTLAEEADHSQMRTVMEAAVARLASSDA